jgi:hypothetical protein
MLGKLPNPGVSGPANGGQRGLAEPGASIQIPSLLPKGHRLPKSRHPRLPVYGISCMMSPHQLSRFSPASAGLSFAWHSLPCRIRS